MNMFEIVMIIIFSLMFFVPMLFGDNNDGGEDDMLG